MNNSNQIISLILTLIIALFSLFLVYDFFFKFRHLLHYRLNNILKPYNLQFVYIFLVFIFSIPSIMLNIKLIRKQTNNKESNIQSTSILDEFERNPTISEHYLKLWWTYLIFCLLYTFHPFMFLIVLLDESVTIGAPIGLTLIIIVNILTGVFLLINVKNLKYKKLL